MGLISKIEEKLAGKDTTSSSEDQSKTGRQSYDNSGVSGSTQNTSGQYGSSHTGGVSSTQNTSGQYGSTSTSGQHPSMVQKAENMLPGHHGTSGQQSASSGLTGTSQNASSGQYGSTSTSGQHPSMAQKAENMIPGHHGASGQQSSSGGLTGTSQNASSGQYSNSGLSGAQDSASYNQGGAASRLQHPIGNSSGNTASGITGGTALTGAGLAGAGLAGSQASHGTHGTQSSSGYGTQTSSGYGQDQGLSGTTDRLQNTHISNSGSTGVSSNDYATPRQPFDPYSSKGQQIAANAADNRDGYGASQGRAQAGDYGSRTSAPQSEVQRTSGGGISNGVTGGLNSGPHSHLENRDAVPTAGGQKLGTGEVTGQHGQSHSGYTSQSQGQSGYTGSGPASSTIGPHSSNVANIVDPRVQPDPALQGSNKEQHHYGRDAAVAGGVGAGAYGVSHHDKHEHGHHSHTQGSHSHTHSAHEQPSTTNTAPYGQNVSYLNRSSADEPLSQDKSFAQRHPAATTAGALGAGVAEHHHQSQQTSGTTASNPYASSSTAGPTSTSATGTKQSEGITLARKLSNAYEAGYRDALEHTRLEREGN